MSDDSGGSAGGASAAAALESLFIMVVQCLLEMVHRNCIIVLISLRGILRVLFAEQARSEPVVRLLFLSFDNFAS